MQVSELYKQVAALGFEDTLDGDDKFYYAANRAILQVNSIRPAIGCYMINHKPMKNLLGESSFDPTERHEDLCFEAEDARAYYFEADGNGILYVERQDAVSGAWSVIGMERLSASRAFVSYRGLIRADGEYVSGTVRLRFSGEYLYSVKSVALYRYLYSDAVDDIPAYEAYTKYDISTLTSDFLALASPPIKESAELERLGGDYDVDGGRVVLLPYGIDGVFKILYHRMPRAIENDGDPTGDGSTIDLDEDLCALLPMLIASYVWLEDEPEKAEYYLNLYRERAADVERRRVNHAPVVIRNRSGW